MNDLTRVLESLHSEKVRVLREQLAAIDRQEDERRKITGVIKDELHEQLDEVRQEELRITPNWDNAQDVDKDRRDRIIFLQKRWDLTGELQREVRNCWLDHQKLEEERREIEKELTTLTKNEGSRAA
jgi:hypothetical protein